MNNEFRSVADLKSALGEQLWQILLDRKNTPDLRSFCDSRLPSTMTVGHRTYKLVPVKHSNEYRLNDGEALIRAKQKGALTDSDTREHVLKHSDEIPALLRGERLFLFQHDEENSDNPKRFSMICWDGERWVKSSGSTEVNWGLRCYFLCPAE